MQGGPHHPSAHCKIDVPVDMRPGRSRACRRGEHRLALLLHWTPNSTFIACEENEVSIEKKQCQWHKQVMQLSVHLGWRSKSSSLPRTRSGILAWLGCLRRFWSECWYFLLSHPRPLLSQKHAWGPDDTAVHYT